MKQMNIGLCAIVALLGLSAINASPVHQQQQLVGANKCTWGPTYWCSNITNAKGCNAVRHCIQTVWESHQVPVDNDSICQICKDMVTQARDQLRSNETMEELKEVFEGSCNLIPIKIVKKECCKLADDFIPELVEALSSQMNPDQVCSVAGLCNNAEIDKLLHKYYTAAFDGTLRESEEDSSSVEVASKPFATSAPETKKKASLTCGNCFNMATLMTNKFHSSNRDDILENLLHLCGEMSSFSDACANIVLTYFNDIYDHIKENLEPAGVCHISGVCAAKYHQHPEDPKEEEPIDLMAPGNDDIPCELCQQLVHHLRDLLVANTTMEEFKQVMQGLCNQTRGFKDECLSIVDQYYSVIYKALVDDLDANGACFLIGVCPKGSDSMYKGDIMPMLPAIPPAEIKVTIRKKLGANEPKFTQEELKAMTLPIDHLMGAANPFQLVNNGELCTICEYLLHFIQETLATPSTEDEIKRSVKNICHKFPASVRGKCDDFIDMYGDAVVALLIQGLNPVEICPKMQMCPKHQEYHNDMEVFSPKATDEQDKPTCPLCLFAVEQAQEKIKNDKSKKNIKNVLDNLCSHLPQKLQNECVDFVETYSSELIDMLISDFKPQEICVALKLCPKSNNYLEEMGISAEDESSSQEIDNDMSLNEIIPSDEMPVEIVFQQHNEGVTPNCLLCEEMVKFAEKRINKHTTKDDIKRALEKSCDKMRVNLRQKCHKYVDRYGDKIAEFLLKEMEPKLICAELGLCLFSEQEDLEIDEALKYDVIAMPQENVVLGKHDRYSGLDQSMTIQEPPTCVLCEFVMTKLEADLKNKTEQDDIKRAIESVCNRMPKTVAKSCDKFVEQYATAIISLIGSVPPKEICQRMQLCFAGLSEVVTDEVIECGVCHGASSSLLPFFRTHTEHDAIGVNDMIDIACENVPAKYFKICSEMIQVYGKSIMHLSESIVVDESSICAQIGKCYNYEKSSLAFARISG
ncbi:prosaposin isoform X2 [Musca autumnalis]|uniref:prosaposin isoform X2 n=1 Tax=Musca autumnalis TaxID=221902 RepID=UPI003CE71E57